MGEKNEPVKRRGDDRIFLDIQMIMEEKNDQREKKKEMMGGGRRITRRTERKPAGKLGEEKANMTKDKNVQKRKTKLRSKTETFFLKVKSLHLINIKRPILTATCNQYCSHVHSDYINNQEKCNSYNSQRIL